MTEEKIKSIVKRYRRISVAWLGVFLGFSLCANWFLIHSKIERHAELGLEYIPGDQGFIWGTVILGLNTVLGLFFYSLEKILLGLYKED